jgi:hypothetical protein
MTSSNAIARHHWARDQFARYRSSVAYIETTGEDGSVAIGTCFHVGAGVFVTAAHVIRGRTITEIGFDDGLTALQLLEKREHWGKKMYGSVNIQSGPHFHDDELVDVACFRADPFPRSWIPLGRHLNDWLGQYELVLHQTLVLGYPPIPFSDRPVLVASRGEINALIDKYTAPHPHFVVSTVARGGFSGGPVLVAYNEANEHGGTAALGLVTESLTSNLQAAELGYMAVLTVEPIYDCLEKAGLTPECQDALKG